MGYKKTFKCNTCGRDDFKSERGVLQHDRKAHPYIPPPPPKKTIEIEKGVVEPHTLLNGRNVRLGDTIWFGEKTVITKITFTEGSNDVAVEARVIKSWYSRDEIS